MRLAHFFVWMLSVGLTLVVGGAAVGQNYPNKPIRIVTGGPGGGADFASRLMAAGLAGGLGQQVIVDNRGGVVPGEIVSQAPPDGYTLLCYPGSLWIGSLLQKTPYDPVRDFAPISMLVRSPSILVVHPSLPVKSVKDLIALAKARPGALNYSAAGTGGATHLSGELFKAMAGDRRPGATDVWKRGLGGAASQIGQTAGTGSDQRAAIRAGSRLANGGGIGPARL